MVEPLSRRVALAALGSAAALAPAAWAAALYRKLTVASDGATIAVREIGHGGPVLMVPSTGRGSDDFDVVAPQLARAGFRVILPEPRGVGGSTGLRDDLTLEDYARGLIAVIKATADGPVDLVADGGGARESRVLLRLAPDRVRRFVSLGTGAGGGAFVSPALGDAKALGLKEDIATGQRPASLAERRAAVAALYFAPGNDPTPWLSGWHAAATKAKVAAAVRSGRDAWWPGPPVDSLVIEGEDDAMAPPLGSKLNAVLGPQAIILEMPRAGHAILAEQPDAITAVLIAYLNGHTDGLQALLNAKAR